MENKERQKGEQELKVPLLVEDFEESIRSTNKNDIVYLSPSNTMEK